MMTACVVAASPDGVLCRRFGGLMLLAGCGLNSDSAVIGRSWCSLLANHNTVGFAIAPAAGAMAPGVLNAIGLTADRSDMKSPPFNSSTALGTQIFQPLFS